MLLLFIWSAFKNFFTQHDIAHNKGILYNPQGQAIVRKIPQHFKQQLEKKQKQTGDKFSSPTSSSNKVFLTLILFNIIQKMTSLPQNVTSCQSTRIQKSKVVWKDVIT